MRGTSPMNKTIQEAEATIEELLEQRTPVRGVAEQARCLGRQGSAGSAAAGAGRLRGPAAGALWSSCGAAGLAISEELERHHASQAELDRQRRAAEEALAEAEVRHSVGEYSEDEWRRVSEDSRREIEQLRESPAQHRRGDHPPHRDSGRHQRAARAPDPVPHPPPPRPRRGPRW